MKLEDLNKKYSALAIYEERKRTPEYEELVFYKNEMKEWDRVLSEALGQAVKPAGKRPSAADAATAEAFGGIRADQVLYVRELEDAKIVAMIWPWSDGTHATLKVFYIRK